MEKDFSKFEKIIGVSFQDKNFLMQAFVHRSYLNEHKELKLDHNERLEFLGDAVLELIVTNYLFQTFPDKPEGELTVYRSALVNTTMLSTIANKISVNDFLLLSRGEERDTGRARQYILANTFEAVIGAIYLDQGYDVTHNFIAQHLLPYLNEIVEKKLWQDAKSHFQEQAQEKEGITPAYRVLEESGPDHDKRFVVGVFLNKKQEAEGLGNSKQEAEQEAARKALLLKNW